MDAYAPDLNKNAEILEKCRDTHIFPLTNNKTVS
jgi:hypothetical protein